MLGALFFFHSVLCFFLSTVGVSGVATPTNSGSHLVSEGDDGLQHVSRPRIARVTVLENGAQFVVVHDPTARYQLQLQFSRGAIHDPFGGLASLAVHLLYETILDSPVAQLYAHQSDGRTTTEMTEFTFQTAKTYMPFFAKKSVDAFTQPLFSESQIERAMHNIDEKKAGVALENTTAYKLLLHLVYGASVCYDTIPVRDRLRHQGLGHIRAHLAAWISRVFVGKHLRILLTVSEPLQSGLEARLVSLFKKLPSRGPTSVEDMASYFHPEGLQRKEVLPALLEQTLSFASSLNVRRRGPRFVEIVLPTSTDSVPDGTIQFFFPSCIKSGMSLSKAKAALHCHALHAGVQRIFVSVVHFDNGVQVNVVPSSSAHALGATDVYKHAEEFFSLLGSFVHDALEVFEEEYRNVEMNDGLKVHILVNSLEWPGASKTTTTAPDDVLASLERHTWDPTAFISHYSTYFDPRSAVIGVENLVKSVGERETWVSVPAKEKIMYRPVTLPARVATRWVTAFQAGVRQGYPQKNTMKPMEIEDWSFPAYEELKPTLPWIQVAECAESLSKSSEDIGCAKRWTLEERRGVDVRFAPQLVKGVTRMVLVFTSPLYNARSRTHVLLKTAVNELQMILANAMLPLQTVLKLTDDHHLTLQVSSFSGPKPPAVGMYRVVLILEEALKLRPQFVSNIAVALRSKAETAAVEQTNALSLRGDDKAVQSSVSATPLVESTTEETFQKLARTGLETLRILIKTSRVRVVAYGRLELPAVLAVTEAALLHLSITARLTENVPRSTSKRAAFPIMILPHECRGYCNRASGNLQGVTLMFQLSNAINNNVDQSSTDSLTKGGISLLGLFLQQHLSDYAYNTLRADDVVFAKRNPTDHTEFQCTITFTTTPIKELLIRLVVEWIFEARRAIQNVPESQLVVMAIAAYNNYMNGRKVECAVNQFFSDLGAPLSPSLNVLDVYYRQLRLLTRDFPPKVIKDTVLRQFDSVFSSILKIIQQHGDRVGNELWMCNALLIPRFPVAESYFSVKPPGSVVSSIARLTPGES